MKLSRLFILATLVLLCTAQRCGRGNSDLLSRIYEKAYKSELPLSVKKDPVYTPLLGSWLVGSERVMVVTKVDETNLNFSFLSNALTGDDISYNGFTTTISTKKYLNMLGYKENYMFFKVKYDDASGLRLDMITNAVRGLTGTGTVFDYLAKNPNALDTGRAWYPVSVIKMSEKERERYMNSKYKTQITGIESYTIFEKKFPKDRDLDSLKAVSLNYSLEHADHVNVLMEYAKIFPDVENKAKVIAKKNCNNTQWCLEYVNYFPNDKAKDSIINIAFTTAKSGYDYEKLLTAFPTDARSSEFEFKIALLEVKKVDNFYSSNDREKFEERNVDHPNVINYFNTLRLLNNIKITKSDFYNLSYLMNDKGKAKIDQLTQLVQLINADHKNVTDIYLALNCDSVYASDKSDLINFKSGVNRCIGITKLLKTKCPELKIHCVPYLSNNFNRYSKNSGTFFLSDDNLSGEKRNFYDDCYRVQQTIVIPNAQKELMNQEYVREEELEEYVLTMLSGQIPLYLKQQPYIKTIPINFWDGSYKTIQPSFDAIKEKILLKAAEKGIDGKKLQNFVIQTL